GNRNETSDGIERFATDLNIGNTDGPNRTKSDPERDDDGSPVGINRGLTTIGNPLQRFLGDQVRGLDVGVVDLLSLGKEHPCCESAKCVNNVAGDTIDQLQYVVGRQHLLTERVQPLQFVPATNRAQSFATGALCELAPDHGREEESTQRNPILGIRNSE